ncbi:PEP-CTERM sorting domain-containing protein [Haloferula sp.]|uniref:PEP-CTERM sorting domain-containing protein n=1 Tax=Haloferula sp. TaxID=2497595 RepID=UPI0032A0CA8D
MKSAQNIILALAATAIAGSASGAVLISSVGAGSGYVENGLGDFRSTSVAKSFDVDGNDEYGTEGTFFLGNGTLGNNQGWNAGGGNHVSTGATWVTSYDPGAQFASISNQNATTYGPFDDPALSGITVANRGNTAIAVAVGGGVGNWAEVMTFTVDATVPATFRIGILSGTQGTADGRWDPTGLRLSVDGDPATERLGLALTSGSTPGWVFFDVDMNGETSGTFSIEGQNRLAGQGTAISGIVFDVIPEPSSVALLGLGCLALLGRRRR